MKPLYIYMYTLQNGLRFSVFLDGKRGGVHEIVVLTENWWFNYRVYKLVTILSSLQQSNQAYVIPCLGNITEGPFQGMWRYPFSCIDSNKDILSWKHQHGRCRHRCCCCFESGSGAAAAATLFRAAVRSWSSPRIHVTVPLSSLLA